MLRLIPRRPSPAMAVAFIALLAALSGTAIALPGKNSVDSGDIRKGAVKTAKIANGAVTNPKVRNRTLSGGKLRNGTITGGKVSTDTLTGLNINESTLSQVPSANSANIANSANSAGTANRASSAGAVDTFQPYSRIASATAGATFDTAEAAAPPIALAERGAFVIYGKCFKQNDFNQVNSVTYIRTSVDGSVLSSDNTDFDGNPFLDIATLETDRSIHSTSASVNNADFYASHTAEWQAMAPGGSAVTGSAGNGAKNGNLPGGNGIYGAGDVCLFSGFLAG